MANPNTLFGFKAISRDSGGPLHTRQYAKVVGDTTAIFMNDFVMKAATSAPDPTGLGNPMPGCTSAQNATPGTSLYLGANVNYGAASTSTAQFVYDALDTLYIAQMQTGLVVTTAAHAGKNVNLLTGTGNALTKQSTMGLAEATVATTAGEDFRIIRVSNISPNAEGSYAICEVVMLKSALGQNTAGV